MPRDGAEATVAEGVAQAAREAEPAAPVQPARPTLYGRAGLARLMSRIRRLVGDDHRAEDLLQSALLRLEEYKSRATVENPEAFLVRTARNLAIDESRHNKVRALSPSPVEEFRTLTDDQPLQDEVLYTRERLVRVEQALATLPYRTRRIFIMRRIEGLRYREIAGRLGITPSAVEKHVAKAVLLLSTLSDDA